MSLGKLLKTLPDGGMVRFRRHGGDLVVLVELNGKWGECPIDLQLLHFHPDPLQFIGDELDAYLEAMDKLGEERNR